MIKFLFKNKILLSVFFGIISVFLFGKISSAQTSGCQIDPVGTKFRVPGGAVIINDYTDNPRPKVYLDVKTINCNTLSTTNFLKFVFYSVNWNTGALTEVPVTETNFYVYTAPSSVTTIPSTFSAVANLKLTNSSDFSIPIDLGENGSVSNFTAGCAWNDNTAIWGEGGLFGPTPQPLFQNPLINELTMPFGAEIPDCMIYMKVFLKNPATPGQPDTLIHEMGSLQDPKLLYECDGGCDTPFLFSNTSTCFLPSDPGSTGNGILPYGQTCTLDTSMVNVTTLNGSQSGSQDGNVTPIDFSEAPLAPLPGFDTNPDLGGFLKSLFTFLIVIAGLLAFIMIVRGGITYLTSDSFGEKGNGKQYIMNAIVGLVLALGAWVILNTINPDLASDLNIAIPQVSISIGDADSFSPNAIVGSGGVITGSGPLPNIGLVCPMSGGAQAVPEIIDSFVGKVTYRWGGKGGPLPSGSQFQLSPNEQSNGQYTCQGPAGQLPCRNFCPDNSVCLDCSGFVNQVRRCSGLPTYSGTSSMVTNQDAIPINPSNISPDGQNINISGTNYVFQPGDILVWNGHVVIYYGNGIIAESAGALTTNTNIKKTPLSQYDNKNKITHLIKINP